MGWLAGDIMKRNVVCVDTDMDLRDVAKLLLEKEITGAPVLDADGSLRGVISQTDLLRYSLSRDDELTLDSDFYRTVRLEGRHLPAGFQIEDVNTGRVSDVMTPVVYSVTEQSPAERVARMMIDKHIHRVIVRKGRKVTGIISALDVLRILAKPERPRRSPRQAVRRPKVVRRARR